MKFHKDGDKRFHPTPSSQSDARPLRNARYVRRPPGAFVQRPLKRQSLRAELLRQDEVDGDSPMIAACYEAHLAMEGMLAAFAELRGD